MTQEEKNIRMDRMRYTKNTLSSSLALLAIVADVLYFVSIYKSDRGSFYYQSLIGISIIYNLLFLLAAFLYSEGVKNRKLPYTWVLLVLGAGQIGRMFILPAKAHAALVTVESVEIQVMGDGQYLRVMLYLGLSAAFCVAAAITNLQQNRSLNAYLRSVEKTTV